MPHHKIFQALLIALLLLLCASCASISSLQTARTVAPKKTRYSVGAGYSVIPGTTTTSVPMPVVELGGRFGLSKKTDLGVQVILPGTLGADFKYQLFGSRRLALATGMAARGVLLKDKSTSTANSVKTNFFDFTLPFYLSYDMNAILGAYLVPKYMARIGGGNTFHFFGSSAGLRLGNRGGMFFEATYLANHNTAVNLFQVSFGLFFGSAPSVPSKRGLASLSERPKKKIKRKSLQAEKKKRKARKKKNKRPKKRGTKGALKSSRKKTQGRKPASVLRYEPNMDVVAVTHPSKTLWEKGQSLCVRRKKKLIACGEVSVVRNNKAYMELFLLRGTPNKGDRVTRDTRQKK